jgi:adenylate kinase
VISITGIPGSGKSSVCNILKKLGFDCKNVLDMEGAKICLEGEEMDIDCLKERLNRDIYNGTIIEGHYSHLLGCSEIFILERDEEIVREVMRTRGYSEEKINENIDALRSDIIYQESLDLLPASRIHRIQVEEGNPEITAKIIVDLIKGGKKD